MNVRHLFNALVPWSTGAIDFVSLHHTLWWPENVFAPALLHKCSSFCLCCASGNGNLPILCWFSVCLLVLGGFNYKVRVRKTLLFLFFFTTPVFHWAVTCVFCCWRKGRIILNCFHWVEIVLVILMAHRPHGSPYFYSIKVDFFFRCAFFALVYQNMNYIISKKI